MSQEAPTPGELEILKALWELGEGSVRDVGERLRADNKDLARNTVQTFLRAMEEKGLVEHRTQGRTFIYRPIYSREKTVVRFVERVFDGAADQLVMSLFKAKSLTKAELDAIEDLIKQARKRNSKR